MNKFLMGVAAAPLLLAGQAHAAVITVNATTLNFGYELPGVTSAGQSFTASRSSSSGTTAATITGVSSPFAGTNFAAPGSAVGASGLKGTYTFKGGSAGSTGESAKASDTITVTGKNGTNSTTDTVILTGTTVAPIETVAGASNNGVVIRDVLVGATGNNATIAVTVQNTGHGNLSGAGASSNLIGNVGALTGAISGAGGKVSLTDGSSVTYHYSFAATTKGQTVSENLTTAFANGKYDGSNAAFTNTTSVTGVAVAPVNNVTVSSGALARFNAYDGTGYNASTIGTVTANAQNTGNGNLSGLGTQSNLNGSFGSPTSGNTNAFSGPNTSGGFSLQDGKTASGQYSFTPTARGATSATAVVGFSNGSSDGTNTAQTVNVTLNGTGVGPTYNSAVRATAAAAQAAFTGGSYNTPVANTGASTIDFGKINSHKSETLYLDIGNTSTDPNGGNAQLTDLSLLSATINGSSFFTVPTVSAVLVEGGQDYVPITFSTGGVSGSFSAVLTFATDSSAGFGQAGDQFSYSLVGSAVPEVSTWAMMLAGFAGLGLVGFARNNKARMLAA